MWMTDDGITKRALGVLWRDVRVPSRQVKVTVDDCPNIWSGSVQWCFALNIAKVHVRRLRGVVSVSNGIIVVPILRPSSSGLHEMITSAPERNAEVYAHRVSVTADGGRVTPSGSVHSWQERDLVERTA